MKVLRINMPDGSKWDVPVSVIAQNRAEYYASEFGGDVQKSLDEDTMPLFDADHFEVEDWASNNMNWSDVERVATLAVHSETDYQEGVVNGGKVVIETNPPIRGAQIQKSGNHDAGAYARCSYCGRYSDKQSALLKDDYPCDCGKLHGWSGSFKKPTAESIWSEA